MDYKNKFNRSLTDVILANIIVLFAVFLSAFIPVVSVALPVLVLIYFEVGLFGFVYKKECGENYKFEDLFISLKNYVKMFCLFAIKTVLTLFWSCVFLVPGIICMLNYSFCGIIVHECPELDVKGVLMLSKELTRGHRCDICFYGLLALASVCVAMTSMFFIIMLFDLFLVVPPFFYLLFVALAGVLDLILLALPMTEFAIVDSYIEAKKEKTSKTQ